MGRELASVKFYRLSARSKVIAKIETFLTKICSNSATPAISSGVNRRQAVENAGADHFPLGNLRFQISAVAPIPASSVGGLSSEAPPRKGTLDSSRTFSRSQVNLENVIKSPPLGTS